MTKDTPGNRVRCGRVLLIAIGMLLGIAVVPPVHAQTLRPSNLKRVLVVDKNLTGESGYKESRRNLNAAMQELAVEYGFEAAFLGQTDNSDALSAANLARFQVVLFNSNEGLHRIVPDSLKPGFEAWVRDGGGFIALHMASAFLSNWPFMQDALVERFYGPHGTNQPTATLSHDPEGLAENTETLGILKGLSAPAGFLDMFISFQASPRGRPGVTILVTVDEKTFSKPINGPMGEDHPVVWTKTLGKGRVVHNSLGFSWPTTNAYAQKDGYLKKLLYNTMRYAAGDFVGCMDAASGDYNPDATRHDPAACIHPNAIRAEAGEGARTDALKVRRHGHNSLLVDIRAGGAHELAMSDMAGRIVERLHGQGAARYALDFPARRGVYTVKVKVGKNTTSHRFTRL